MVSDTEVVEIEVSYTKQITYISYIQQNKLLKFNFQRVQPYAKKICVAQNEDFLRTAVGHLNKIKSGKRIKDDADIFAEGWALTFRMCAS